MKKIKDFFYDYNDVLVSILIVLVAAVVLFWRVNVVMNYAEYAETGTVKHLDIDFSNIDLTLGDVEDIKTPDEETKKEEQQQEQQQQ